jgi:hypothetical protein
VSFVSKRLQSLGKRCIYFLSHEIVFAKSNYAYWWKRLGGSSVRGSYRYDLKNVFLKEFIHKYFKEKIVLLVEVNEGNLCI